MNARIEGTPSFGNIHITLENGETLIAESDAMSSMDTGIDIKTVFNGGFFKGIIRKFLGGESLFVNRFTNSGDKTKSIVIVQPTPGDVREIELKEGQSICMQPGAFIACEDGVKFKLKWAGFASFIGREGLFKIEMEGPGKVWYGSFGALVEREVAGDFIVDSSHLVAYDPELKLKVQLAGGIFSSFFGGEGLVTRVEGNGKLVLQTRSLSGIAEWVNPRLW